MSRGIRIVVASGKGGTGKTTIATNLAVTLARAGGRVAYVDCDVEEPNGHIFLRPVIERRREVSIPVPEVDRDRCTLCGACGRACRYSAILALPTGVLTFPNLCHGCGGCTLACPEGAIREVPRVTGVVEEGASGDVGFVQGVLNVGEAMAPPVIRAVLDAAPRECTVVLDAPPGTSCPVIESVRTADVALLVTEPTPFGLNDLQLAVLMLRELGLPIGVAVNRAGSGNRAVFDYCAAERIPILLELPDDRTIARAYSRGQLAVDAVPQLVVPLAALAGRLVELSRGARPARVRAVTSVQTLDDAPDRRGAEPASIGLGPDTRELVVVSGKGGTGKTSIVASFFALAREAAVADCDVDAANLHLVLAPGVLQRAPFCGGSFAVIDAARCTGCGICLERCRFHAIEVRDGDARHVHEVRETSCEGCGVCVDACSQGAASLVRSTDGEWFVSDTRHGPMAHARLGVARENSGKLVSLVRRQAKTLALARHRTLLICDGSPGIGCPVIASIAGAQMVLLVAEPTLSGLHDLGRVADLCRQFNLRTGVCVNKADINPDLADQIESEAAARGLTVLGRIRYDEAVTAAQIDGVAVVERGDSLAAMDIRALWERLRKLMA
jgi:MinD superfamily P-loop ATPase